MRLRPQKQARYGPVKLTGWVGFHHEGAKVGLPLSPIPLRDHQPLRVAVLSLRAQVSRHPGVMAECSVFASHEAVRYRDEKFSRQHAHGLRRQRGRLGDLWQPDEVLVRTGADQWYLWRAVDLDGSVLDVLVQDRRNKKEPLDSLGGNCAHRLCATRSGDREVGELPRAVCNAGVRSAQYFREPSLRLAPMTFWRMPRAVAVQQCCQGPKRQTPDQARWITLPILGPAARVFGFPSRRMLTAIVEREIVPWRTPISAAVALARRKSWPACPGCRPTHHESMHR